MCRVEEINGFLRKSCHYNDFELGLPVFKCPYSNTGYKMFAPAWSMSVFPFFNSSCPNDKYGYQVIVNVRDTKQCPLDGVH